MENIKKKNYIKKQLKFTLCCTKYVRCIGLFFCITRSTSFSVSNIPFALPPQDCWLTTQSDHVDILPAWTVPALNLAEPCSRIFSALFLSSLSFFPFLFERAGMEQGMGVDPSAGPSLLSGHPARFFARFKVHVTCTEECRAGRDCCLCSHAEKCHSKQQGH